MHNRDIAPALPEAVEAEQALLGAILVNNQAYWSVAGFLKPMHFIEQVHQIIYETAGTMIAEGRAANPVTVKPYVPADQKIGEITVGQYLARLCTEAVTVSGAYDFGRAIMEIWARRQLIAVAQDLDSLSRHMPVDMSPEKIIGEVSNQLTRIAQEGNERTGAIKYGVILPRAIDKVAKASVDEAGRIPWFIDEITHAVGYMRRSNLIGLMSDSGGGKTSFSLQQLRYTKPTGREPNAPKPSLPRLARRWSRLRQLPSMTLATTKPTTTYSGRSAMPVIPCRVDCASAISAPPAAPAKHREARMVDRFDCFEPLATGREKGEYVRYSDYAALEAENGRLTKERDEALEQLNDITSDIDQALAQSRGAKTLREAIQFERRALAERAGGVKERVAEAFREFCIRDWNRPHWWGSDDTDRFVARLAARLTTAGYRILGPDEVDAVTLEKAAATAEGHRTEGWRDPEVAEIVVEEVAAAIRALGRKA